MSEIAETTLEDVEGHVHRCVAEVRSVIGRDAAAVERHHWPRFDRVDPASLRVVEVHPVHSGPLEASDAHRGVSTVPDVQRDAYGRERLDRRGLGKRTGVDPPEPIDRVGELDGRCTSLVAVAAHQNVSREP